MNERLTWWLCLILRFYPARFRNEFGDEMQDVLTARLQDAATHGRLALVMSTMRETLGLLVGAMREHRHTHQDDSLPWNERAFRILGQSIVSVYALGWLTISLLSGDALHWYVPIIALAGALIAPRHRKVASSLIMASTPLAMLTISDVFNRGGGIDLIVCFITTMPLLIAAGLILDARTLGNTGSGAILTTLVGSMALAWTWWTMRFVVAALTEQWLVPWDTWAEPIRPPAGTWQRTLNDFFEGGIGAAMPATTLIGIGIVVLVVRLWTGQRAASVVWLVTAANLLIIVAGLVGLPLVGLVQATTPEAIGYRYTWPGILILLLSSLGLLSLARKHHHQSQRRPHTF